MEKIAIQLPDHSYPIYIGSHLMTTELLKTSLAGSQAMIVTNETVAAFYLQACLDSLPSVQCNTVILPDGEAYKTLVQWQMILESLLAKRHHRDTTLISLGGGVIGDMTGFAASCYQRGVDFIQVPTTLLAQVDASIGGKTAVNHPLGKNMIGAFHQPKAVIIDLATLATLSAEEFACGMAEVIKAAVIADAEFFTFLEEKCEQIQAKDPTMLTEMVKRACLIKANIVQQDEREQNVRALLNFGHTFGHALEKVMGYGEIKHGQAVAIGMMLATRLAEQAKMVSLPIVQRLQVLLQRYHLPTTIPAGVSAQALLDAMQHDKKIVKQQLRLVLPTCIGNAVLTANYPDEVLNEILIG